MNWDADARLRDNAQLRHTHGAAAIIIESQPICVLEKVWAAHLQHLQSGPPMSCVACRDPCTLSANLLRFPLQAKWNAATPNDPLEHDPSPTIEPFCRFWSLEPTKPLTHA